MQPQDPFVGEKRAAHRMVWFRADEWLLYVMDSPIAAGARGFTRGTIYSRDGQLVASVAQEGLMRIKGFAAASDK